PSAKGRDRVHRIVSEGIGRCALRLPGAESAVTKKAIRLTAAVEIEVSEYSLLRRPGAGLRPFVLAHRVILHARGLLREVVLCAFEVIVEEPENQVVDREEGATHIE